MTGIVESVAAFFGGMGGASAGTAAAASSATALSEGAVALGAQGSLLNLGFLAPSSVSLTSLLSNGLTLASVAQSLSAGQQQAGFIGMNTLAEAKALELASKEDLIAARDEEIAAQRAANDILENTRRAIASQQLAASANGIDVSYGTPAATAENTQRIGNAQASTTRSDAQIRALARRRQSTERLIERGALLQAGAASSSMAITRGISSSVATVADQYFRGVNRG